MPISKPFQSPQEQPVSHAKITDLSTRYSSLPQSYPLILENMRDFPYRSPFRLHPFRYQL